MNTPQFILVNCLTATTDGQITGGSGRSVAFPVAKARGGKLLFATCSHTITAHIDKGLPLQMLYSDGMQLPEGEPINNHVIPVEFNYDLCFFETKVDRELRVPRFGTPTTVVNMELSHVRNVSYRADFSNQTWVITTQTATTATGSYTLGGDKYHQVDQRLKETLGKLPKNSHRGINIRSWPGTSGSPLWNRHGIVVGMVAGGTTELTPQNPQYNMVYLPTKHILFCLKKFLSDRIA